MRAPTASSLIVLLAAACGTAAADEVRRVHRFDTAGIEHLHIDYSAGELVLMPADGDRIEVELRLEPRQERSAREGRLEDVDLASRLRGDRLTLSFKARDVHSRMLVSLPPVKRLSIDAGAGEVQGTLPPVAAEVRLGAGDIDLHLDRSVTGRVDLRAWVGDTALHGGRNVKTRRAMLVGSTSSAVGQGSLPVEAKVRVGDVRVGLR